MAAAKVSMLELVTAIRECRVPGLRRTLAERLDVHPNTVNKRLSQLVEREEKMEEISRNQGSEHCGPCCVTRNGSIAHDLMLLVEYQGMGLAEAYRTLKPGETDAKTGEPLSDEAASRRANRIMGNATYRNMRDWHRAKRFDHAELARAKIEQACFEALNTETQDFYDENGELKSTPPPGRIAGFSHTVEMSEDGAKTKITFSSAEMAAHQRGMAARLSKMQGLDADFRSRITLEHVTPGEADTVAQRLGVLAHDEDTLDDEDTPDD